MIDRDEDSQLKKRYKKQRKSNAVDEEEIKAVVKTLLQNNGGRKFLWWLLEIGKLNINPFTANALTTSFNAGELNVGQQIQARIIEASPEGYLNMLKERQNNVD